jgi:hypothetical protein
MLTIVEIDRICESSNGLLGRAVFAGLPARRTLYISQKIRQFISGADPTMDVKMRGRWLTAHALFESYVGGKVITAKSKPNGKGEMAILHPWEEGIWEFRDVKPSPGLRIFGSFAQKDVFIALSGYKRLDLGSKESREWTEALESYKIHWTSLFDGHSRMYRPMSGSFPDEYLSNARSFD